MGITPRSEQFYILLLLASVSTPLHAEDIASTPAPDKSAYTLFNPTPDTQMRSFCTDRPTKSNSPCTLDVGHFQYEADAFNWTYNHNGSHTQNTYLFTNPTFKLGLTNRIDFEVNIAPLVEVSSHDKATHSNSDLTGMGDLYLRAKYSLFGNDGGNAAMTLFPYVKIPTAAPGIGNKSVEEGLIVPISFALPQSFSLVIDPEIDAFKDAQDTGYHTNYQGVINVSHTLFSDAVTGAVELWSDVNNEPAGTTTQLSFDTALSWVVRPNLQLDIGANIGLNRATPDLQSYIGISQRF